MFKVLDCPISGLDYCFPDNLYVVRHSPSNKYGCYCYDGVHGLACFSTETAASQFAEWLNMTDMVAEYVGFDEAREIAKRRPMPIVSVMLLDNLEDPMIHFVR